MEKRKLDNASFYFVWLVIKSIFPILKVHVKRVVATMMAKMFCELEIYLVTTKRALKLLFDDF